MAFVFNPYGSQDLYDDPYPVYRELRDRYPAYRNDDMRFWALSRFEDVWRAVHDHATFSSAQGITVVDEPNEYQPPQMILMDPPRHDQLRALVSRAFTPRRIASMEDRVRAIAAGLVDEVVERGEGDFVRDLAIPLPSIVISELLGVPPEDRGDFRRWTDAMVAVTPDPQRIAEGREAAASLFGYFVQILAGRRKEPRDDLISALIAAEVDGEAMSEEELVGFCFLLLIAGNETTTNLISNGLVLLARHRDQRAALAGDPSLLATAVEELLRYEAPVQGLARTLTRDVELHRKRLREGDKVLLLFAAANRDDREFDDPDRLDLRRPLERHLAFGHGIHFCLGAALARLEGRLALDRVLARIPEYELTTDTVHWTQLVPVRGVVEIPVSVGPVVGAGGGPA